MAAYLLVDCKVTDPAQYEEYKGAAQSAIESYGGRYLVRGGGSVALEGNWQPNRIVVLEFPTLQQASVSSCASQTRRRGGNEDHRGRRRLISAGTGSRPPTANWRFSHRRRHQLRMQSPTWHAHAVAVTTHPA